jgi:4-hydroxybenzoate polyprenyltransferase
MLFFGLLAIALVLVLLTNRLTVLMAFFGALLAATYPFFKRFTHFPQLVLGAAFSWAIPMAFAAEAGHVPELAWWLFAVNLVWTVIYDTEYAMADREDDLKVGVKSTAIAFGRADVPMTRRPDGHRHRPAGHHRPAIHPAPGLVHRRGHGLLLFQLQLWRIRERNPAVCFRTFLSNHWVGMVIWLGAAIALLRKTDRLGKGSGNPWWTVVSASVNRAVQGNDLSLSTLSTEPTARLPTFLKPSPPPRPRPAARRLA